MNFEEHYGARADTLVLMGGEVKMTGTGKFGGELCLFTTPKDHDLAQDFFDAKTDYDIESGDRKTGYYNHGLDIKIGNRKIGSGILSVDSAAVWVEGQLKDRDEYIEAIEGMINDGKLGFSSGSVAHLVRREKISKSSNVHHITHWPIAEWSLTPTPCEPRTLAVPLKTWAKGFTPDTLKGAALGDNAEASATIAAVQDLNGTLMGRLYSCLYGWDDDEGTEPTAAEQLAQIGPMFDEYRDTAMQILSALITDEEASEGAKSLLFSLTRASKVKSVRDFEDFLRDAGYSKSARRALAADGYKGLRRDAGSSVNHTDPTARAEALRELARSQIARARQLGVAI